MFVYSQPPEVSDAIKAQIPGAYGGRSSDDVERALAEFGAG